MVLGTRQHPLSGQIAMARAAACKPIFVLGGERHASSKRASASLRGSDKVRLRMDDSAKRYPTTIDLCVLRHATARCASASRGGTSKFHGELPICCCASSVQGV